MNKHDSEACASNICETDPEKHLRTWFPDEEVCYSKPFKHWQKIQHRIHKFYLKGKLKFPDQYYTFDMLSKKHSVHQGITGIKEGSPKEKQWVKDSVVASKKPSFMPKSRMET